MKATFILKDKSGSYIDNIKAMPAMQAFDYLNKEANGAYAYNVSQKIGNGSFRDKLELNQIMRKQTVQALFGFEPRKGYILCTFTIQ
jgi:hypothetical protein